MPQVAEPIPLTLSYIGVLVFNIRTTELTGASEEGEVSSRREEWGRAKRQSEDSRHYLASLTHITLLTHLWLSSSRAYGKMPFASPQD